MRRLLFILFAVFVWNTAKTQTVSELRRVGAKKTAGPDSNGWKHTGLFVLNVNQSAQSNWNSGAERFQIGINAILNKAMHHRKGKYTFDTYLDIELGVTEAASFKKFRKTSDRFDLTFEVEHRIGKKNHFNYGVLANINTQLFTGHNYAVENFPKISSFLSPGKFLVSPGIDYKNQNKKRYFSFFISPLTFRWVTKVDESFYGSSKFGVDSLKKVFNEIGPYLSIHYNVNISKTSNLITRVDLFTNYKKNPQNVDVLLNNVFTVNISKIFAATFLFDLLYDHDIKARTQVQEVTGIGLKLKL
jgi:Protein of unknown function (DUF3078)